MEKERTIHEPDQYHLYYLERPSNEKTTTL